MLECRAACPHEWGTLCTRPPHGVLLDHANHRTGARWPSADVYPTGVLSDLLAIGRALNPWWLRRRPWPSWLPRHPQAETTRALHPASTAGWRRNALRHRGRRLLQNARHRAQWRGWYAEGNAGAGRVGTGWTRRRALLDLQRHLESRPG